MQYIICNNNNNLNNFVFFGSFKILQTILKGRLKLQQFF